MIAVEGTWHHFAKCTDFQGIHGVRIMVHCYVAPLWSTLVWLFLESKVKILGGLGRNVCGCLFWVKVAWSGIPSVRVLHSGVVYSGVGWCKTARSCEKQCVVSDEAARCRYPALGTISTCPGTLDRC